MHLEEILSQSLCKSKVEGVSKKRVIGIMSSLIAEQIEGVDEDDVFEALMNREQLGTTGIGNGIAIPHCRIAQCDRLVGALVSLAEPVDYLSLIHI